MPSLSRQRQIKGQEGEKDREHKEKQGKGREGEKEGQWFDMFFFLEFRALFFAKFLTRRGSPDLILPVGKIGLI